MPNQDYRNTTAAGYDQVGYDVPASVLAQFPELHKSPSVASQVQDAGGMSPRGTNYMQVLGEAGWPSAQQQKTTTTVTGASTSAPPSAAPNQVPWYPNWGGCCPCCGRPYGYYYPPYQPPAPYPYQYPIWVNAQAAAPNVGPPAWGSVVSWHAPNAAAGGCAPGPVPGSTYQIWVH